MGLVAALVVAVVLAGVVVGLLVWPDDEQEAAKGVDPTPSASASASPTPSVTPSESPSATPTRKKQVEDLSDVRELPAGLLCRNLADRGYSYVAAVDYWRSHGQPLAMDADGNGIPCETVYPVTSVEAYWGPQGYVPDTYTGIDQLEPGLFCRDLRALGYTYPQAVDYWWTWGSPDRMDADRNGIPCESVYPQGDVSDFWYAG